eukprot:6186677-Pleurochrysis_carterae.AAC.2
MSHACNVRRVVVQGTLRLITTAFVAAKCWGIMTYVLLRCSFTLRTNVSERSAAAERELGK